MRNLFVIFLFLCCVMLLGFSQVTKPVKKLWMVSLCLTGHISTPLSILEQLMLNIQHNSSKFDYKITIASQETCREKVTSLLSPYNVPFEFIATSPALYSKEELDVYLNKTLYTDSQRLKEVWSRQFMPLATLDYELLLPHLLENRPDVILADVFSFGAKMLARDYKIPLIGSNPSVLTQPMVSAAFPSLTSNHILGKMTLLDRIDNALVAIKMLPTVMSLAAPINDYRKKKQLAPMQFFDLMDADVQFAASAIGINYVYPNYDAKEFYFGAILSPTALKQAAKNEYSTEYQTWLQNEVIYVSMGTVVKLSPRQVLHFLEAFRSFPQYTFIWSIPLYQQEMLKNETIPSHVHIVKYAPQLQLLQHSNVKLFISHAGGNSVHESLFAGKPLICFPAFGDQIILAGVAEYRKFGKRLDSEEFTSQDLKQAIETVTTDAEYTSNAKRLSKIIQMAGGSARAAQVLEELIDLGEFSHLKSSDSNLSLIERKSLDLWAILLLIVYSLYKIVAFVFGFFWRICCTSRKQKKE